MKQIIPGEYDSVARASLNRDRLRAAHRTPCDASTAYFLIAFLHEKHFPNTPMPEVRLREPIKGKTRARGWGGVKIRNGVRRGYVSLPKTPLPTGSSPYGYLRIGLVCHEYAHTFQVLKFNRTGHDAEFTMILDMLLFETSQFWERA